MSYVVCIYQNSKVEVVGAYAESGDAARACSNSGRGAHVVKDRSVVRTHGKMDPKILTKLNNDLREGKHPALTYQPPAPLAERKADESWKGEMMSSLMGEETNPAEASNDAPPPPPASETPQKTDELKKSDYDAIFEAQRLLVPAWGSDRPLTSYSKTPAPEKRNPRCRVLTVRGEARSWEEWATKLGITSQALMMAARAKGITDEEEIALRLDMLAKTGSAKVPRGSRRSSASRASDGDAPKEMKPRERKALDATDGTLSDLRRIMEAVEKHGGIEALLDNADLGSRVRKLVAQNGG